MVLNYIYHFAKIYKYSFDSLVFMIYDLIDYESNGKVKKYIYHLWSGAFAGDTARESRIKEPRPGDVMSMYKLATYDKDMMCFDEPLITRQFRSVVFSHPENQLLSFSPPRSLSMETFCEEYKIIDQNIQINELIEGNLIHFFYDNRKTSWEIATKNAVGGNYNLIHKIGTEKRKCVKTVRNMFMESLGFEKNKSFDKIPGLDSLDKEYSYCFVLQHPENNIILSNATPSLYLVSVYDILDEEKMAKIVPQYEYESWKCFQDIPKIRFPRLYHFSNYAECVDSINTARADYSIMGYNITNLTTGERCVIMNKIYESVYLMKCEPDDILYLYLCLLRIQKVKTFLIHFSKYKKMFSRFYEQYQRFIKNIHSAYLEKWVYKKSVHDKYSRYVDRLHKEIYIPSLATADVKKITAKVVFDFINELKPEEVFYFMNYDRREFNV